MKSSVVEAIGITLATLGVGCMVAAAWLLAGMAIALVVAGGCAVLAGYLTVRAAALSERKSP